MTAEAARKRAGDSAATIVNAMSVDVEDYFQVGAFETCVGRAQWDSFEARVDRNTNRILDLFGARGVKATFFVLGWVAERQPALIRRIVAEGHELASHGYAHDRVTSFTAQAFKADLARARGLLEDAGSVRIKGYRAPSFSIGERNAWALEVLAEAGYAYSSSIYPIRHDHYGWVGAPRFAHFPVRNAPLVEIPVSTVEIFGSRQACGGGGFFRLLPYSLSAWAIRRLNERDRAPAIFYFHPWEIDPDQPRVPGAPLRSRLRHYTNLSVMEAKLTRALDDFAWDRVDRVFLDASSAQVAA